MRIKNVTIRKEDWSRDGKIYAPKSLTGLNPKYHLNPVQEQVLDHINLRENLIISTKTGTGKTACLLMLAYAPLRAGEKICYVAPYKALTLQKYNQWKEPTSAFGKYNLAVVNSDFKWTKEQVQKVQKADIICATPEALLAAIRNFRNKRNRWPLKLFKVFIDEAHLICAEGRGANLEMMISSLTGINPDCEIVLLSGTLKNAVDFQNWLTRINGRPTSVIASDYRPVPLTIKWEYMDYDAFNKDHDPRLEFLTDIALKTRRDVNMFGVFNKRFGYALEESFKKAGVQCAFHSADIVDPRERQRIESALEKGLLRDVINTSTLSTGMDYPIYRVVVTQVAHYNYPIPAYEIQQLIGRAGRFPHHTSGEAIIILPKGGPIDWHKQRILEGEDIKSQLLRPSELRSHLLGAIYSNDVTDTQSLMDWMKRTLAYEQYLADATPEKIKAMLLYHISKLVDWRMLAENADGHDYYEVTTRGKICAQMLLDPEHFYTLIENWRRYGSYVQKTDFDLAKAIAQVPAYYYDTDFGIDAHVASPVLSCVTGYRRAVQAALNMLTKSPQPDIMRSVAYTIRTDAERYMGGLMRLSDETKTFKNGVTPEQIFIGFTRLVKGITQQQAQMEFRRFRTGEIKALSALGLFTLTDVRANPNLAATVLSPRRMGELGIKTKVYRR